MKSIRAQKIPIEKSTTKIIIPFGRPGFPFLVKIRMGSSLKTAAMDLILRISLKETDLVASGLNNNLKSELRSTDDTSGIMTILTLSTTGISAKIL